MNMRILLAVVLVCVAAGSSQAQRVSKVTGARLLKLCSASGPIAEQCDIYLSGVADAMGMQPAASRLACIPMAVTGVQLREVALKAMHEHPEKLELPAGDIATHALTAVYACKK
jgi:hypothetical protein